MIFDFLRQYWKIILEAVLVLISFIILIIRIKNKKVDMKPFLLDVVEWLPTFINSAEDSGLSGSEKYSAVLEAALKRLSTLTNLPLDEIARYASYFDDIIEEILSTPQKKEVSNEKKVK